MIEMHNIYPGYKFSNIRPKYGLEKGVVVMGRRKKGEQEGKRGKMRVSRIFLCSSFSSFLAFPASWTAARTLLSLLGLLIDLAFFALFLPSSQRPRPPDRPSDRPTG